MNKNLKKIVAMALAIGGISAATPASNVNLFTTKAYAASDNADTLDNLELYDEDNDTIELYEDDEYEEEVESDELEEGETYYAETSSDTIHVNDIDGADEDNVRIFKGSSETAYEVGDDISISSDTTLKIRIYEDEYDDYDDYDDANDSDYNEYEIEIEYTGDDDAEENDEDTLDSLELYDEDDNTVELYENDDYDDEVDSDEVEEGETYYAKTSSDQVTIETDGPDDDYVKIFKSTSNSSKGIDTGDSISVTGNKTLTVRIYSEEPDSDITYEEDENVIGEYVIKLEYNEDDSSNTSTETEDESTETTSSQPINNSTNTTGAVTDTINSNILPNQWVQVDGKWQYNDALGQPIKNTWFYDKNLGKNYYLQADGNMAVGWLNSNGKWYYLGVDGAMKTGWQLVNGNWYYLDTQGVMAYNTTINGYKVGSNGAWIK